MNNLFSSFDPVSYLNLPLNWMSAFLVLVLLPAKFWLSNNQSSTLVCLSVKQIKQEFSASLNSHSIPGILLIPLSMCLFVMLNNFLGLIPYIFTASSHLTFTLTLALPLWVGHIIMASFKTPNLVLAHFVPLGTPNLLIPFMILVEIISSVIRPLTLSVRLAANMTAGHLLLALLGNQGYSNNWMMLLGLVMGLVLLATLETAVSLIQGYVFSVLSTLYLNEVNSSQIAYFKL